MNTTDTGTETMDSDERELPAGQDQNYDKAWDLCGELWQALVAHVEAITDKEFSFETDTKLQLRKHYLKQFYFAFAVRNPKVDPAKKNLLMKAGFLAYAAIDAAAKRGSKTISPRDVHDASFSVDCPPKRKTDGRLKIFYDFCS